MNLIIDIGNTRSKYFVFDGEHIVGHGQCAGHTLEFVPTLVCGDGGASSTPCRPEAVMVSSVVDLPADEWQRLELLSCPVLRFSSDTPVPLQNGYRTPQTLGVDRLAAAVGAWAQHPGHPLLIIDAGSCVTFDFVSEKGEYIGGNIAPGLHARLRAIGEFFPRLPLVSAEGDVPELGYDTETAVRAGVIEGMRHEIEGYIGHFQKKYDGLLVFLTGGDANHFEVTIKSPIFADPFIVPRGLNCILEHNKHLVSKQK